MTAFPKHQYIRSQALLEACRELPCQHCGAQDGTVCAAHTNWGGGKGRSIKADDNLVASLCARCHFAIDQGKDWSDEAKKAIWTAAHRKTVWLLQLLNLWPKGVPVPGGMSWA